MKFLHTADVLIDGPIYGLSAEQAETRRAETLATFCDMLAYAKEQDVELFLVAGDLFDAETFTAESAARLRDTFAAVPFPIVIAPGPHDPYMKDSPWTRWALPDNVHVFDSSELTKFTFEEIGVTVYGYAFTAPEKHECPLTGRTADDSSPIRILVGAGELGETESAFCPLPTKEIGELGVAYAALGHKRNATNFERYRSTVIAYACCPEPHSFEETGPRGAILGELEKTPEGTMKYRSKRIPFAKRHCEKETVDCSGAHTEDELANRILDRIRERGYGEDTILHVTLTGATAPALICDEAYLAAQCKGLFAVRITDETVPDVNAESYESDTTMLGALVRNTAALMKSGDEKTKRAAVLALRYGIGALTTDEKGVDT